MFNKKPENPLARAPATNSIFEQDIVIRISVWSAIILSFITFILICLLLVPQTYGFFWY